MLIALPPLLNYAYLFYQPPEDDFPVGEEPSSIVVARGAGLPTVTPFLPFAPTREPFRPLVATPVVAQVIEPSPIIVPELPQQPPSTAIDAGVAAFLESEPGLFHGIDFVDRKQRVTIKIYPSGKRVNGGKPITISFIPGGRRCEFGDKRACVNTIFTPTNGPVTFLSIHSGVGGEAQRYRSAIEGTGLDQALYSLKQVQANLNALAGSEVEIIQGDQRVSGLRITAITRIPAKTLNRYVNQDLKSALELAADLDGDFAPVLNTNQPQVVFETCGWKMPGEPWAKGVSATSASIYLTVIQKTN